jgi:hypothetical protein
MIRHSHRTQNGATLLVLLLIFMIFAITLMAYSTDPASTETAREQRTFAALAEAKRALLAYAALQRGNAPRPGELPRPATQDTGQSGNAGGNDPLIGWFPWQTLETEELADASGAHLWYAVAGDFYNRTSTEPVINPDSVGTLHFGMENDAQAVAIIIAPGPPLSGQSRPSGLVDADTVIQHYLEGANADANLEEFTSETSELMNDRVVFITVDEIMPLAARAAMDEAQRALKSYYTENGFYPYAEYGDTCDANTPVNQRTAGFLPMIGGAGCPYEVLYDNARAEANDPSYTGLAEWFNDNEWYKYIMYMVAPACAGAATNNCNGTGFLSLDANNAVRTMLAYAGPPLNDIECTAGSPYDQSRSWPPPGNICAYLETNENTNLDLVYIQSPDTPISNDRFLIVE